MSVFSEDFESAKMPQKLRKVASREFNIFRNNFVSEAQEAKRHCLARCLFSISTHLAHLGPPKHALLDEEEGESCKSGSWLAASLVKQLPHRSAEEAPVKKASCFQPQQLLSIIS